jgi:hypothetical protein
MTPVNTPLPPPDAGKVEGPSFPLAVKVLATVLVAALALQGWQVIGQQPWRQLGWPAGLFLLSALVVIASGYWGILTSRTSIDGRCIRQSWLWPKEVVLADITQVKLLHVPGLSWLMVPRLVVRSGSMNLTTFHAADPQVLAALRLLAYGGKV